MPRMFNHHKFFLAIAIPGLVASVSPEAPAGNSPIRTANSQAQVGPPPAPVPDPVMSAPGNNAAGVVPGPATPGTSAVPPVPPPEPGSAMYSGPMGTFRQPPPPPKVYMGDPNGLGSGSVPLNSATPTPLNSNQLPALDQYPTPTTDRFGFSPPPGTLGQTYMRRSSLISEKKHPRVGVVQVNLSENYDVSAKGLKSKWTGKVWELESDPLLPGIPHIFEVKAEWGPEGAKMKEVRTVRLIMGRVVDLDF